MCGQIADNGQPSHMRFDAVERFSLFYQKILRGPGACAAWLAPQTGVPPPTVTLGVIFAMRSTVLMESLAESRGKWASSHVSSFIDLSANRASDPPLFVPAGIEYRQSRPGRSQPFLTNVTPSCQTHVATQADTSSRKAERNCRFRVIRPRSFFAAVVQSGMVSS